MDIDNLLDSKIREDEEIHSKVLSILEKNLERVKFINTLDLDEDTALDNFKDIIEDTLEEIDKECGRSPFIDEVVRAVTEEQIAEFLNNDKERD